MKYVLVLFLFIARCAFAHSDNNSTQPQFTSSPVPVSAANVGWKASRSLSRGIEAWASGKRAHALLWFEDAVHRSPADSIAWHNLGVAAYCASRFEEAHRAFTWQRLLNPSAPTAWYGLGMCEQAMHRLPEAANAFIVAVNQAPREWEYWHRLGVVMALQGQPVPAAYAADRAARLKLLYEWPRRYGLRSRVHASIMGVKIPRIPSTAPR